jgi:hypothetical protein
VLFLSGGLAGGCRQVGGWVGDRGAGAALAARGGRSVWMAWFGMRSVGYGMAWHGMAVMGARGVRVDGVLVLGCA